MQRATARQRNDAPAIRNYLPGERVMAGSFAVPLRQRAAGFVSLDRKPSKELVDFDVVCKVLARRDARRDRVSPAQLCTIPA